MRGRRTQPSDRAAKSATATQFATWCAEDQLTYTPLIIAHYEGKWGQKLTLPWTVPRPGSRLCASAAAGVISLRLDSFRTDTIRGEFDQLAKRVTAETGQSACSGGACLRQAIWSWCCLALRIPQIQHTCRYAVHRWSDSSAMRQSPITDNVYRAHRDGFVGGETPNTRSCGSRARVPLRRRSVGINIAV